ncbi:hypothetical protein GCM10020331_010880 [Ectobacillus funiculus]
MFLSVKPLCLLFLINDGKVIHENLNGIGWNVEKKLQEELGKKGVLKLESVYLATIDAVGALYYSIK